MSCRAHAGVWQVAGTAFTVQAACFHALLIVGNLQNCWDPSVCTSSPLPVQLAAGRNHGLGRPCGSS